MIHSQLCPITNGGNIHTVKGSAYLSVGNEETGSIRSPKCSMILWMGSGRGKQICCCCSVLVGTIWLVGSKFPDRGANPGPLHWKCGVNHCTSREVAGRHSFNHIPGFLTLLTLLLSPGLLVTISSSFQNCADQRGHLSTIYSKDLFVCWLPQDSVSYLKARTLSSSSLSWDLAYS